jgi:hypothetical protein
MGKFGLTVLPKSRQLRSGREASHRHPQSVAAPELTNATNQSVFWPYPESLIRLTIGYRAKRLD